MQKSRIFFPEAIFLKVPAILLVLFMLAACVGQYQPVNNLSASDTEIANDFSVILQDPFYFAFKDGEVAAAKPLLEGRGQEEVAARAIERFFSPWAQSQASNSLFNALWGYYWLKPERGFMENLRPYTQERWAALAKNSDLLRYPSRALPAITVEAADLRLMPTNTPYFFSPVRPGQGYPFDYYQNSTVPLGTPLFISHISKDGLWALVETPSAGGWVAINKLALVNSEFMVAWKSLPLGAILLENTALAGLQGQKSLAGYFPLEPRLVSIGTLLPMEPFSKDFGNIPDELQAIYYPIKGAGGYAIMQKALLPKTQIAAWPLPLTRQNIAKMIKQMLGQPYGWGGYGGNRDCSSTLREMFLSFGVWLPRNSRAQAGLGDGLDLSTLSAANKEATILREAVPFISLIGLPGHIVLYIGEYEGRAVVFHNIWGLSISQSGTDELGRAIIGKAVLTTLTPGRERQDIALPNSILDAVNRLSFPLGR